MTKTKILKQLSDNGVKHNILAHGDKTYTITAFPCMGLKKVLMTNNLLVQGEYKKICFYFNEEKFNLFQQIT